MTYCGDKKSTQTQSMYKISLPYVNVCGPTATLLEQTS